MLRGKVGRAVAALGGFALVAGLATVAPAGATPSSGATGVASPVSTGGDTQALQPAGRTDLRGLAATAHAATPLTDAGRRLRLGPEHDREAADTKPLPFSLPDPKPMPLTTTNHGASGFSALDHADSVQASNSVNEPSDQGLCTGNGYVIEGVNDALAVYSGSTQVLVPVSLNAFYGLAPAVSSGAQPTYGPFVSDPRCVYDWQLHRFVMTVVEIDDDPYTGALATRSRILTAVSVSDDPTGDWGLFAIDTTDDGSLGTPKHPGCPCFGDQPLLGFNADGIFLSASEYSIDGSQAHPSQLYALSKQKLAAAAVDLGNTPLPPVIHLQAPVLGKDLPAQGLQPAIVPPGGTFAPDREYLLSSLDVSVNDVYGNAVHAWALTNTESLATMKPTLHLYHQVLPSLPYVEPVDGIPQARGPIPLADALHHHRPTVTANDDRMNQVVFADGRLWSGMNTALKPTSSGARVGVAWVAVHPSWSSGFHAQLVGQGYLALSRDSVVFPAVAVNPAGNGAIAVSILGPGRYPSTGYVTVSGGAPASSVHLLGAGTAPEDGASCYPEYVPGTTTCRWGDYSGAAVDEQGRIWVASEYIPPRPRTTLGNWGTFVAVVDPHAAGWRS